MKYKIALLLLLVAGMLTSCNSDEEIVRANPDYVEAGYGTLAVTLTNPGCGRTKAGEALAGVATDEEKTIGSVAFFVNTEDETIDGIPMVGAFGAYFSTEELFSSKGLLEGLTETSGGVYTAKIRHKSDGWHNPQVIVIANYVENGLAEVLGRIDDWDGLSNVLTSELTSNPQTPLLMYAFGTIDSWIRTGEGSNGGGTAAVTFGLQRLVSRIDIHNNAYNSTEPNQGFVLSAAQLVNPKTRSYLLPENVSTGMLGVADQPFAASGTPAYDAVDNIQKLDTLYAYENANNADATATAVRINGTYRGSNISRTIAFKDAAGSSIALARNTRYVININPAADSTDITWNIQVGGWNEADTIKVRPAYPVPVLAGFDDSELGVGMSWNATTKTIRTNGTATGKMTFKARGTNVSVVRIAYGYDTDGSSIDGGLENPIYEIGDAVITYAAEVETPLTVNVPRQKSDEMVPLDIYVIVQNGRNREACDTLTIESRPGYNGTALQPVLMRNRTTGGTFFWAPVNAGATAIPVSVASTGDITSTCGNIFQWGRKLAFPATSEAIETTSTLVNDTTDFESKDTWRGKFITSSATSPVDWLTSPINTLWNTGREEEPVKTAYDPCPKGWRVPTMIEWGALGVGVENDPTFQWDGLTKLLSIAGVEGTSLVLPAAGFRDRDNIEKARGSVGFYSSSSALDNGRVYGIVFASPTLSISTHERIEGWSVRCIQE